MGDISDLTPDAARIMLEEGEDAISNPVLQVLQIKQVNAASANQPERHRIILSDGVRFVQGMLASQMNDLVHTNAIDKWGLIKLVRFAVNTSPKSRRLVIVLEAEVLVHHLDTKLGEPKLLEIYDGDDGPVEGGPPQTGAVAQPAQEAAPAPVAAAPPPPRAAAAPSRGGRGGASSRGGRGGAAGGGGGSQPPPVFPIEGLSPYQNKWTIKARVLNKSDVRHWHNAKGEGKLFSVTLMDETGEIRATGFGDHVDKFHDFLQEGKVYYVSRGKITIAKKQFSGNVNNEYEIQFDSSTDIQECQDTEGLPQVKYNFTSLASLNDIEKDQLVDVLGIVQTVDEVSSLTSKSGRAFDKRELQIVDTSGFQCRVTLFGNTAKSFTSTTDEHQVIAFKGVKVGDFGGRSLSMVGGASMQLDPDIDPAHELRGWYDTQGSASGTFQSHVGTSAGGGAFKQSEFRTLTEASMLGQGEGQDYFNTRATIIFIKPDNMSYPACQTPNCNKKVTRNQDDSWGCEKCGGQFDSPRYRYVMSMNVADAVGSMWLSAFDDVGQLIMGGSANDLEAIRDANPDGIKKEIVKRTGLKSFNFACRAKTEVYNDTSRVKFSITKATPVNFAAASQQYLEEIRQHGIMV